jgi:hypothetical protein
MASNLISPGVHAPVVKLGAVVAKRQIAIRQLSLSVRLRRPLTAFSVTVPLRQLRFWPRKRLFRIDLFRDE